MRIGFGYDSHRLVAGRPLILGGVTIDFERGLDGHSDADVLCHAVTDALLGAAHMGNIGTLFPDSDPAFKNADSLGLLQTVIARLDEAGWAVGNIDAVILMEQPKLNPHVAAMEASLAAACGIGADCVSVKPKTNEKMGPVGSGEGVVAYAVCLLIKATK